MLTERDRDVELDTTIDPLQHGNAEVRRGWIFRAVFMVVVAAILLLACLDFLGFRSRTLHHDGAPLSSTVTYGQFTRRGISTPLQIDLTAPDGFDGDVTIMVNRAYMSRLTNVNVSPQPDSETTIGDTIEWTFQRPDGSQFGIQVDAQIDPSAVPGWIDGRVDVGVGHHQVDTYRFRTWIWP